MKIMMVLVLAANDADSGVSGNDFWAFGNGNGNRQPIAVSDISVYICLIDIRFRSKSKEQLNERRAGLSIPFLFQLDGN